MSDTDDSELTIDELMELAVEQAESEAEMFNGDVPTHSERLLAQAAQDVSNTIGTIEMIEAEQTQEDPTDDEVALSIETAAVEVLMALGALEYEYDLDIAKAARERYETIRAFDDADDIDELLETAMQEDGIDEDDLRQMLGVSPEAGTDTAFDEFDGTPDRHIQ